MCPECSAPVHTDCYSPPKGPFCSSCGRSMGNCQCYGRCYRCGEPIRLCLCNPGRLNKRTHTSQAKFSDSLLEAAFMNYLRNKALEHAGNERRVALEVLERLGPPPVEGSGDYDTAYWNQKGCTLHLDWNDEDALAAKGFPSDGSNRSESFLYACSKLIGMENSLLPRTLARCLLVAVKPRVWLRPPLMSRVLLMRAPRTPTMPENPPRRPDDFRIRVRHTLLLLLPRRFKP